MTKYEMKQELKALYQYHLDIAIEAKKTVYEKFIERNEFFTSDNNVDGTATTTDKGIYFVIEGCQCKFSAFVTNTNQVIRKPRVLQVRNIDNINVIGTEIEKIW